MNDDYLNIFESSKVALEIQEKILKHTYSKYFILWGIIFIFIAAINDIPYFINIQLPLAFYLIGNIFIISVGGILNGAIFKKSYKFINFKSIIQKREILKQNIKKISYLFMIIILIYVFSIIFVIVNIKYFSEILFYFFLEFFIFLILSIMGIYIYKTTDYVFEYIPIIWKISLFSFIFSNLLTILFNYIFIFSKEIFILNLIISSIWIFNGILWITSGLKFLGEQNNA